ncbi:4'-phosphopantetheinyl transferase superfamily protein [Candidatus Thorarchaeota archaeon]|nr:MAG: 4'-phosphopantetheinyl transferase superfamily protein [Candidatus Thorarchaeota archaeon]
MIQADDVGVGVDLANLKRFRAIPEDRPFYDRVYSLREMEYCRGFSDPIPHLAAAFAAKEAVMKAIGIRHRISMKEIEILHDEHGAPFVESPLATHRVLVSLTHTEDYAAAVALALPAEGSLGEKHGRKLLNSMVSDLAHRSDDIDEQL